jgi:hypothetical protein
MERLYSGFNKRKMVRMENGSSLTKHRRQENKEKTCSKTDRGINKRIASRKHLKEEYDGK